MSFEGDIANFPIADVIQIITLGKKTGALLIDGKTENVRICFKDGYAIYAHPTTGKNTMEEALVNRGIIKREQLKAALFKQSELAEKGNRLHTGTILKEMDLVTEDEIRYFIELETRDCIYRAISEEEGFFRFEDTNGLSPDDVTVLVDVEEIIIKGIDRIDKWIIMKKAIGSNDSIFEVASAPDEKLNLSIDEWKVLSLIDGNRVFNEILLLARLDHFRVSEIIHEMLQRGVISKR